MCKSGSVHTLRIQEVTIVFVCLEVTLKGLRYSYAHMNISIYKARKFSRLPNELPHGRIGNPNDPRIILKPATNCLGESGLPGYVEGEKCYPLHI